MNSIGMLGDESHHFEERGEIIFHLDLSIKLWGENGNLKRGRVLNSNTPASEFT